MSIIGSLPFILTNGQTADATQVMADFNTIIGNVNASAFPNASLPLAVANGGTGLATGFMPAGTIVGAFLQAAAPTGWTQSAAFNDQVLKFTNNGGGGSAGGSWSITGVTVGGHAVTQAELPAVNFTVTDPSHVHQQTGGSGNNDGAGGNGPGTGPSNTAAATTGITVASGGSNTPHGHPFSNDGTWRPAFVEALVAVKQ